MRMSVSSRACVKDASRGKSSAREVWRYVEPQDAAPVAHLELLGHRLEPREEVADVLEIVRASVGERERAYPALEQRNAKLLLEALDLMAHGGRSQMELFRGRLEAFQPGGHLEGLEKLERR